MSDPYVALEKALEAFGVPRTYEILGVRLDVREDLARRIIGGIQAYGKDKMRQKLEAVLGEAERVLNGEKR